MERGNTKHNPREDDMLAADLDGSLGHGSNREEWVDPEPPADDDITLGSGAPVEGVTDAAPEATDSDRRAQHDMDVANDWHDS